ncbi:unnamed protein product [Linum tenue]|uniref:Uncharacterized protein n=1 Tax=Linum tenue TaxID=586396 RepID=A0AAV0MIZ4_9ROSI|nr:unnamed protein product [Linum tenue]
MTTKTAVRSCSVAVAADLRDVRMQRQRGVVERGGSKRPVGDDDGGADVGCDNARPLVAKLDIEHQQMRDGGAEEERVWCVEPNQFDMVCGLLGQICGFDMVC